MALMLCDLPNEVIINIFRFLNVKDIQSVSLTCKNFYEISKCKEFVSQRCLHLVNNDVIEKILSNDYLCPLNFPQSLKITCIASDDLLERLFTKFRETIKHLTLENVPMLSRKFPDILENLKQLESLTIEEHDLTNFFRPPGGIPGTFCGKNLILKSLTLNHCHINSLEVVRFSMIFPKLENFSVINCYGRSLGASSAIFQHLPSSLKELHINTPNMVHWFLENDNFLESLRKAQYLKHLHLNKLTYSCGSNLPKEELLQLIETQKNLIYLDLSHCGRLTDESINKIVETLPDLEVLKLKNCSKLTDGSLIEISKLKKLKSLDISKCMITPYGITEGIAKQRNDNLEELRLAFNKDINEHSILFCIVNFRNLKVLDLEYCPVTNDLLEGILWNLKNLKELNLSHCKQISDDGFVDEDSIATTELLHSTFDSPNALVQPHIWLGPLRGLHVLNLDSCIQITDTTLKYGLRCLNLKELNVRKCKISSKGLQGLSKNCPSIEKLILSQCELIDDTACHILLNEFKRLEYLNVRDCRISCLMHKALVNKIGTIRY